MGKRAHYDNGINGPMPPRQSLSKRQRRLKWIEWGKKRILANPTDRPTQRTARLKYGWPSAHEFTERGCFPEGLNHYCKLIGANTDRERRSDDELIAILKNWTIKKGVAPRTHDFDVDPQLPCSRTYSDRFGSWQNAIQFALGSDIDKFLQGYRFWRRWQRLCAELARKLYGRVEANKIKDIKGLVDIYIPHKKLIIDAMTSSYAHPHKESEIERYIKSKNQLEFWCLNRGRHEYSHPKLTYVYSDDLMKRLLKKGLRKEAEKVRLFSALESGDYTKDELKKYLREIYKKVGRPISTKDVEAAPPPVPNVKIFNKTLAHGEGFAKACEIAGVPYAQSPFNKRYSKDDLLNILKDIIHSGKPVVATLLADPNLPSPSSYSRSFGSIGEALKVLGVDQTHTLTDEEVITKLRKACVERGQAIPLKKCTCKIGLPSYKTYIERFGSYDKALKLAGFPRSLIRYDRESIINEIIRYKREHNKWPSAPDIDQASGYPSSGTVKRYFGGSFTRARKAAITAIKK